MPTNETEALALTSAGGVVAPLGSAVLAELTEAEFETRIETLKRGKLRVHRMLKAIMTEGVDYGTIPGVEKKFLHKPGCETMCAAYGLVADMQPAAEPGDGKTGPLVRWRVKCVLRHGSMEGPIVAVGHGTANTWETKYRYRLASRTCPDCEMATIIKGQPKYNKGIPNWICHRKRGGCGAGFAIEDERITSQVVGYVENPDQVELDNTCLKMAEIRAYRDAVYRGTATSGLFAEPAPENEEPAADGAPAAEPRPKPAELVCPSGSQKGKRADELKTEQLQWIVEHWMKHRAAAQRSFASACSTELGGRTDLDRIDAEKRELVEAINAWRIQDPESLGTALGASGFEPTEDVEKLDLDSLRGIYGKREAARKAEPPSAEAKPAGAREPGEDDGDEIPNGGALPLGK